MSLATSSMNLNFRLFYLYQGTRMTWIKEETLFTLLHWMSPVITCTAITIQLCEGLYLSLDAPILMFYRDDQNKAAPDSVSWPSAAKAGQD